MKKMSLMIFTMQFIFQGTERYNNMQETYSLNISIYMWSHGTRVLSN